MPLVRWSSRSMRIVPQVLGPLGAMVGLIWAALSRCTSQELARLRLRPTSM